MHTFSVRVGAMAWVRQEAFVGTSTLCSQIPIAIVCGLNTSCPRWKSVLNALARMQCAGLLAASKLAPSALCQLVPKTCSSPTCLLQTKSQCTRRAVWQHAPLTQFHLRPQNVYMYVYTYICIWLRSWRDNIYIYMYCQGALEKVYSIVLHKCI